MWSGRLDAYRRIRVLGAGKGRGPDAAALENLLGDRISDGLVIVKYGTICRKGNGPDTSGSRKADTRSPMRRARRLRAEIVDMARDSREDDLVLCTFTGGASALTPALPSGNPAGRHAAAYLYAAGMRSDNP